MAQKGMMSETRSAMQELLTELDQTRREYAKLSLQLTQQDTMIQHLKDAEAKKDQVIVFLQEELTKVNLLYGKETEMQGEEKKTRIAELEHRNKYLEMEIKRLQEENKLFASFEKENRQLRDTNMQHQVRIEKLQSANDDLRSRASNEMSDFRSQLEIEFKRRLTEAEKKFRAEAYRALSEEAKVALQGNDHLQLVLQRQNNSIEGVLARCKQLESSHDRMKTEQDLSQQNLKQHQNEVQRLRKQLTDSKAKNTQLEDALRQRRIERASLELLYMEYEATRKELQRAQQTVKKSSREAARWRSRAIKISTDLGRTDGFDAMEQAAQRQERVDEQLRKEKVRRERRQRIREKRAANALKVEDAEAAATTDPTSSDYEGDPGANPQTAASRVNPIDMLSMWNINFDAWQGDGPGDAAPPAPAGQDVAGDEGPPGRYDGDAEQTDGAGDPRPTAPHEHQPARPKKPSESTTQARLHADRNLSVLSRQPRNKKHGAGGTAPLRRGGGGAGLYGAGAGTLAGIPGSTIGDTLTIVNGDGDFSTRKKKFPAAGGGAAAAAAPSSRFFVP
eukprot:TRINITY_DN32600_c0_g1_i1.p1 TRINITY_DN32600_c0_g1~~TRINITY_DN32600_c0_g1_i1.p1  ORF type:complete len:592 (+),score=251.41 TRINITY_DN32600_c0_g1_i1:89-1777(+)